MAYTNHSFQEKELQLELGKIIANNKAKTARRGLEGWHLLLENICGAQQTKTYTIEDDLNINGGKKN